MENEHKHHVVAWWTSGQAGIAKSDSAPNAIHFTAPPEFGGLEGRWTPEEAVDDRAQELLYDDVPHDRGVLEIQIRGLGCGS